MKNYFLPEPAPFVALEALFFGVPGFAPLLFVAFLFLFWDFV